MIVNQEYNPNPVINYDGISKNVTGLGFHEHGKWMYTGGEDNSVRIWDLRLITSQIFPENQSESERRIV
jgi:WD40 repeat protein